METERAWLEGIRRAAETTKNIAVAVAHVGLSKQALAQHIELERKVLAIRMITPPERLDDVLAVAEERAALMTAEEALDSAYRDVLAGWLPGGDNR
jgi:hypothetical protein